MYELYNTTESKSISKLGQVGISKFPASSSMGLNSAIQCVKATFPNKLWTLGLERKDPKKRIHVNAGLHLLIVPGKDDYPHLTIFIEHTHVDFKRGQTDIEFTHAHYSPSKHGARIVFEQQVDGSMKAIGNEVALTPKILAGIEKWLVNAGIEARFTDGMGRNSEIWELEEGFYFESARSTKPKSKKTTKSKPISSESSAELPLAIAMPKGLETLEHQVEALHMEESLPITGESLLEAPDHPQSKKKKKKKTKAQTQDKPTKPIVETVSRGPMHASELRIKMWEDALGIDNFETIAETVDLKAFSPQELEEIEKLFLQLYNRKSVLESKQIAVLKKKSEDVVHEMIEARYLLGDMLSGKLSAKSARRRFDVKFNALMKLSDQLIPTHLHRIDVDDVLVGGIAEKRKKPDPVLLAAVSFAMRSYAANFSKLRIQEYFSMSLNYISHLDALCQQFCPSIVPFFRKFFNFVDTYNYAMTEVDQEIHLWKEKEVLDLDKLQQRFAQVQEPIDERIDFFRSIELGFKKLSMKMFHFKTHQWKKLAEEFAPKIKTLQDVQGRDKFVSLKESLPNPDPFFEAFDLLRDTVAGLE
ncbi:hypothetical protein [Aureibacter tunicatorum]|uniref:Uncharacterized protein n=1 Tax=Aureibacter tunicatorum TaxID=866807 RepID=A0AAE3XRI4_9BACT|nr:hypothetical protein [Aureibacter tunicatorum]MDR6241817.1 hypothetical protein [Aureibacter tunicatorum]